MKKKKFITLLGSILLIFGLIGLPAMSGVAVAKEGKPIVLGVPLPMGHSSGPGAANGIKLAVEEINSQGGVNVGGVKRPFEIKLIDTRDLEAGVPISEALLAVEKLILGDKVDFIVGGPMRSEAALAAMDIQSKYKKVTLITAGVLTPGYHKKIAKKYDKYKYNFRTTGNAINMIGEMISMLETLKKEKGVNRIYMMIQDVSHARGGKKALVGALKKRGGWEIVGDDVYPTGASDYSAGLLKARAKDAQILFAWFDHDESAILVKQWHDMKLKMLLMGYIFAAESPGFWKATNGKAKYVVTDIPRAGGVPTKAIPWSEKFVNAYVKKFGVEPVSEWTPCSYMGPYILKDAIERAGSIDADPVIAALEKTDLMGVYGRIRFDPKSHQIIDSKDPAEGAVGNWIQWIDGKMQIVYPPKLATGSVRLPGE